MSNATMDGPAAATVPTLDIDQVYAEIVQRERELRQAKEDEAREQQRKTAAAKLDRMKYRFRELPHDLMVALEPVEINGSGVFVTVSPNHRWVLEPCSACTSPGEDTLWDIREEQGYARFAAQVPSSKLRDQMIVLVGRHRAGAVAAAENRRREEAAEIERQDKQRLAMEDSRNLARTVERCLAEARAALVQWPEGWRLTLYRWEWQRGVDADGAAIFASGWSRNSGAALPALSSVYVTFEPTRGAVRRHVRIFPAIMYPQISMHEFSSVDELPDELKLTKTIDIPGISDVRHDDDGRWLPDPMLVAKDDERITRPVGDVPLPWICDVINERAGVEAPVPA
jgi:hypothetical protein